MIKNENYSFYDEKLNSVIHALGALLSIAAISFLIYLAVNYGNTLGIVSFSIYGFTLIVLFLASAFFHGAREGKLKKILEKVDHSCVFLLIAGSYTPFAIVVLNNTLGWVVFGIIWILAIIGIIYKIFYIDKFTKLSTILYLIMGWISIIPIKQIIYNIGFNGFLFLLLGGMFYTVGVWFYLNDHKLNYHPIWHLFVIYGSASHYFIMINYILPKTIV